MGQFNSAFTTPIGGGHISGVGGYIDIWKLRGSPNKGNPNQPFSQILSPVISLDVAQWMLPEDFEQTALECSGNLGATDYRLTGYNNQFQAIIIRDINTPPCEALRGINGNNLVFWCGTNPPGLTAISDVPLTPRYYWSPDGVIKNARPVIDARGKKMDLDIITGVFRSHVFFIDGITNDPTIVDTPAGAYAKFYWGYTDPGNTWVP